MLKRKLIVINIWSEIVKLIFTFIVRHYFSLQAEYYRIWEIKEYHKDPNGETHPSCRRIKMQRRQREPGLAQGINPKGEWVLASTASCRVTLIHSLPQIPGIDYLLTTGKIVVQQKGIEAIFEWCNIFCDLSSTLACPYATDRTAAEPVNAMTSLSTVRKPKEIRSWFLHLLHRVLHSKARTQKPLSARRDWQFLPKSQLLFLKEALD